MSTYERAKGRVLHFNEASWNRLQEVLAEKGLHLMAEHVAEQRKKDVVVLDLDDPNLYGCSAVAHEPAEIVAALRDTNSVAAHGIASQIEAQTKPPRIPEPGLWGVVEAVWDSPGINGIGRAEWMHVKGGRWQSAINPVQVTWECLIDPVLVRDGIKDEQ